MTGVERKVCKRALLYLPLDQYSIRLHLSMFGGRFKHFCLLLDSGGVDPNALNEDGRTPLILACYVPNSSAAVAMVRKLHQHGADLNKRDLRGQTLLHHAVLRHHLPIIRYLLDIKLDLNPQDHQGNTPLHLIVLREDLKLLKLFVNVMRLYCIKSEIRNDDDLTPLLLACRMGRLDMARYLSKHARHSPVALDRKTVRNGRTWLETLLFIPTDVDPFNCPEEDLLLILPKPADYISKDCVSAQIKYDWHSVVCSGVKAKKLTRRPKTAPPRIKSSRFPQSARSYGQPNRNESAMSLRLYHSSSVQTLSSAARTSRTNPTPLAQTFPPTHCQTRRPISSACSVTSSSCLDLLSGFLALKATSEGVLPAAAAPIEEELTPSELDALELEDRVESQTPSKMSRQQSNPDQKSAGRRAKGDKSRQKMDTIAATASNVNKLSSNRRRRSAVPS